MDQASKIDTMNICMVGVQGPFIRVMHPGVTKMTQDTAINLAAWIVAVIPDGEELFKKQLEVITNL